MDEGKISVLVLLDLSAAFDHYWPWILLPRHHVFGFGDTVLTWLQSYLENRTQIVTIHGKRSTPTSLCHGVPQGSVLGPIFFILYLQPLSNIIKHHPALHQVYADDTHIYKSCTPSEIVDTIKCIEQCITNVKTWMFHKKLKMKDDDTEAILFAWKGLATEHLPKLIKIIDITITFMPMIRDLRITLDSCLSFNQQVMNTCRSAFYELRRISSIRKYLIIDATKTIVCSLVLSRLDYCNSIL